VRPGSVRVVGYGPRNGYVQRPFRTGYVSRTYVVGGRTYVNVYRSYSYHGISYYRYVPGYYYHPRFYAWAYGGWPAPVGYRWGWASEPWYGYYGAYFTPEPAYPSATLWLTDFLLAANLQAAWQSRDAADQQPATVQDASYAISPELKQQIADEVRAQLQAEQAAVPSAGGSQSYAPSADGGDQAPPALKQRTFIVASTITANVGGQDCQLTGGDVIYRSGDTLTADSRFEVMILNSKQGDCPADSRTEVELADLQEMQNQFQEKMDAGMKTLADHEGTSRLPSGPGPDTRSLAEGQASADPGAVLALEQQQRTADQAEAEVSSGAGN
jgi:hypothetical protein